MRIRWGNWWKMKKRDIMRDIKDKLKGRKGINKRKYVELSNYRDLEWLSIESNDKIELNEKFLNWKRFNGIKRFGGEDNGGENNGRIR